MKKISIVVVEDHKLIREMWTTLLAGKPEAVVVGESGEFNDAIEVIRSKRPDVVLLDINLPDASGMDAVPLIRKYVPASKVIAVSMHHQPAYAKKMLQLGAKGYVTKNSSPEEMFNAIDEVMNGNTYICREIKDIISEQALNEDPGKPDIRSLSLREIEIIRCIRDGLSSKEISSRLDISLRTVEVHRHNILKKLKLKNAASLVNFINTTDLSF